MILTRSTSLVTVSLFCLVAMPASSAMGATKKKAKAPVRPSVTSVAPLKAGVGDQLTIKGKNFQIGKNRNTVFFKAGAKPAVSAKAVSATRTTMKVVIPTSVAKYFAVKNGIVQPTRFKLRVLAKRFAKGYTATRLSPTITNGNAPGASGGTGTAVSGPAADCDGDTIVDAVDTDDDNDLLTDALEVSLKLAPCSADTDGDGVEDGWEYHSALDLNRTLGNNQPYPGKRPYPNPLDGTDGGTDYDGDGITMAQEHLMWKAFGAHTLTVRFNYSAGLKRSNGEPGGCATLASEDCNDDYRDVDGDGLANFDEFNGPMSGPDWWKEAYEDEKPYTEVYDGTSAIDADSDGDGLLDGADDTDHDLWTNAQEVHRIPFRTQPFNPCLPDYRSPTCSVHPPFKNPYPPFDLDENEPLPPAPIAWPPPVE